MKAPDKLYISKNIYGTYIYQVPDPDDKTEVEYVRADALIEKACEFIKERIVFDDNAWYVEGEITLKDKVMKILKTI